MCFNLPGCELAAVQSRWVRARGKRVYHFTRGCFNGLFWLWIFQSCEKADIKTMTKFHSLYIPFASVWRPSDRWSSSSWILHDAENTRWGSAMWYMDVFFAWVEKCPSIPVLLPVTLSLLQFSIHVFFDRWRVWFWFSKRFIAFGRQVFHMYF